MKYLVLAFVLAFGIWYFFIRSSPETTVAPAPVSLTPQQEFEAVISKNPIDAAQLASVCSRFPQLGVPLLRGKQFNIAGTVAEVRSTGIEGRRGDVVLNGPGPRKIVLVCDLDQYSRPAINFWYLGKFEAAGTELLYLVKRDRTLTKKVVTTQGARVTQFAALKTFGGTLIEFNMVNGPQWAGAETNK